MTKREEESMRTYESREKWRGKKSRKKDIGLCCDLET